MTRSFRRLYSAGVNPAMAPWFSTGMFLMVASLIFKCDVTLGTSQNGMGLRSVAKSQSIEGRTHTSKAVLISLNEKKES
jgi:hypothetical protein